MTVSAQQIYFKCTLPQITSVFICADTKLTKKHFWLQMNKLIMVVEIVEQFSAVLTLFRCASIVS